MLNITKGFDDSNPHLIDANTFQLPKKKPRDMSVDQNQDSDSDDIDLKKLEKDLFKFILNHTDIE